MWNTSEGPFLNSQPSAGAYLPGYARGPIYGRFQLQQGTQFYQSMAPTPQYPVGQYPAQCVPPIVSYGSIYPGASFSPRAAVNIPLPPPSYARNVAPLTGFQGQYVKVQQKQAGWCSRGTYGGFSYCYQNEKFLELPINVTF